MTCWLFNFCEIISSVELRILLQKVFNSIVGGLFKSKMFQDFHSKLNSFFLFPFSGSGLIVSVFFWLYLVVSGCIWLYLVVSGCIFSGSGLIVCKSYFLHNPETVNSR